MKSLGTLPTAEQDAFAALGELQEALPGKSAPGGPGGRARGLRCVCYGLGNFCSCGKARLQLAFLLLLLEELKVGGPGWGWGGKGGGDPEFESAPSLLLHCRFPQRCALSLTPSFPPWKLRCWAASASPYCSGMR